MNPSSSAPAEGQHPAIALRDTQGSRRIDLSGAVTTFGSTRAQDVAVATSEGALLFTLVRGDAGLRIYPGDAKIRLNGAVLKGDGLIAPLDVLEWKDGRAVYLGELASGAQPGWGALEVLNRISGTLREGGSLSTALHLLLNSALRASGAETAVLLSESGDGAEWRKLAVAPASEDDGFSTRELFSHTILSESLKRREPVVVENLVGHPWASAPSIMISKTFSVGCLPLLVDGRPFGALYLFTRTPGRSLRKSAMAELALFASQASLMLAAQSELQRVRRETARLRNTNSETNGVFFGTSVAAKDLARRIEKLAALPLPILIQGETGVGKEITARELHARGPRAKGAFVAVNCAAIPETLLESTLFGHVKGAFTGAHRSQPGRFQMADGGTLFLDEIGDLSQDLQAKLLRVLQERTIEPVGAARPQAIDVRVLAATHRDLEKDVAAGRFRQDLYFRLKGAELAVPSLRDRREDILALAELFLKRTGVGTTFSAAAATALQAHSWPGNVRELEHVVTRAAFLTEGIEISTADLELGQVAPTTPLAETDLDAVPLKEAQRDFTRRHVQKILDRHDGSRALAASELGVSERTLYRILSDEGADTLGGEA